MAALKGLAGVLVISVAIIMWQQYKQLGLQQEIIQLQTDNTQKLDDSLKTLANSQIDTATQVSGLMLSQQVIQQNLSTRNADIRRMQSDIAEIREWANQPLPGPIVRVRNRPTITGAAAYSKSVSAGNPVRADSVRPADQR